MADRGRRGAELGLVTFAPDDLDWDDEVRIALEERASLSPDALTGHGGEPAASSARRRMETKIFGPPDRVAELDLQPAERVGPGRRAAPLRHRPAGRCSTESESEP